METLKHEAAPAKKTVFAEAAPAKAAPTKVIADDSSSDGSSTDETDSSAFLSFSKGDSVSVAPPLKKIETQKKAVSAKSKAALSVTKVAPTYIESLSEDAAPSKALPAEVAPVLVRKGSVPETVTKIESPIASTASSVTPPSDPANSQVETRREVEVAIARSSALSTEEKATVASAAANVEASKFLHPEAAPAIKYFTLRAAEGAARDRVERREMAEANMSESARYFDKLEYEAKVRHAAEVEELISAPRPAAIEKFTSMDIARKEKQRAEIRQMIETPPEMPAGQAFFTEKMREENERKRAEIEELKNNPPPASAATEYFKVKEEERMLEIDRLMAEPAPVAIEFFTQKAREEKEAARLAHEKASAGEHEPAVATKYFVELDKRKAADIEAARSHSRTKEKVEPLPFDYFSKQGEEQIAARARSSRELAVSQMPPGIAYFTLEAEREKARKAAEGLDVATMSVATKYFHEKALEEAAVAQAESEGDIMPAAIQKFTLEARAKKDKERAEIRDMIENPPELQSGQAFFTRQMQEEQARKRAEIEELKNNPPPASAATEYFKVKEEERKLEIDRLMAEPAPVAIEFFTQKAREEKEAARHALERAAGGEHEPAVATKYFVELEKKKTADVEAARSRTRAGAPTEPLPVDYFAKLDREQTAARARSSRELAVSQMPPGIAYFTLEAEREKAGKAAEGLDVSTMSVATKYFHEKALEEAATSAADAENDIMPAAIQKFTLAAREESTRRRAALEDLKHNPLQVPPGIAHFTT